MKRIKRPEEHADLVDISRIRNEVGYKSELRPARPPARIARHETNELRLRNVAFEVDDLQAAVDRLSEDGYGLVGDIGQYAHIWHMAYVRGPEGIIVSLVERIG